MKIAHECMNSIQDVVRPLTDYDYFLVHLLDSNPTYRKFALNSTRMRILDNSIFELGVPHDWTRYKYWIRAIEPDYTVIPDALDDMETTLSNVKVWFDNNPPKCTRYMAVLQGQTELQMLSCWNTFQADPRISLVGVSFDSRPFLKGDGPRDIRLMINRHRFIGNVTSGGTEKPNKPIHLLGCALPQEMYLYKSYPEDVVYSVDTSSPVVHGFNEILFTNDGVPSKVKTKLHTLIDNPVNSIQEACILRNIKTFRGYLQ